MINGHFFPSTEPVSETRQIGTLMPLLPIGRLENHYLPNSADIVAAARQTMEFT
jgi:hypothetical protein